MWNSYDETYELIYINNQHIQQNIVYMYIRMTVNSSIYIFLRASMR